MMLTLRVVLMRLKQNMKKKTSRGNSMMKITKALYFPMMYYVMYRNLSRYPQAGYYWIVNIQ